ncbi:MAG: GNAT family N-acetyltransferase [Hyphomicrobiaceae bacterium]
MRVDNFTASIHRLNHSHVDLLHALTVGVLWPHRRDDLELFLDLGHGYLALDEIGRPIGSAMYFPMGADFAMLGMMVTVPRLQTLGTGRWLLSRIMAECGTRDLRLSATKQAYHLYLSAGFQPVVTIRQQQGIARAVSAAPPPAGTVVRRLEAADGNAVHALDTHSYGADRRQSLDRFLGQSTGMVAERDGATTGFALLRNFGRGLVIGPVVAEDATTAVAMMAPLIADCEGRFLRVDTPLGDEAFLGFLTAAGLAAYDTVTEMRLGPHRRATAGAIMHVLAGHSFG